MSDPRQNRRRAPRRAHRGVRRRDGLLAAAILVAVAGCDSASPTSPDDGPWGDPEFDFAAAAIAFESNRDGNLEIYLMTADGRDGINVTNHPAADGDVSWSPDGTRIAFASDRAGNTEIYVMNVDGSDVTRITNDPATDRFPAWSPDGTRIAFASDRDGNFEIYSMDATGLNEMRLTRDDELDTEPVWSADGSRIIFQSNRTGNVDIWSMEPNGSTLINLTNDPAFDGAPATATWSGAEGRIAFVSDRAGGNMDIYTMAEDGSQVYRVTTANELEFDSSWMFQGELLLFDSFRDGNWDIFVVEPSGAATGRLTSHPADDESPVWRPQLP